MQAPAQAPVTVPMLTPLGQAPASAVGGAEGHTKVWSSASKRVALIAATTQATPAQILAPGPGPSVAAFSVPPIPAPVRRYTKQASATQMSNMPTHLKCFTLHRSRYASTCQQHGLIWYGLTLNASVM